MKALVLYYSLSGKTRQAAEKLAGIIQAKTEAITDLEKRKGVWGFLKSGSQATRGVAAQIAPLNNDPAQYDLVVVCTPIWAGKMSSPVHAVLNQYGSQFNRVAYLITRAAPQNEYQGVFDLMDQLSGKQHVAARSFCPSDKEYLQKVEAYAQELQELKLG